MKYKNYINKTEVQNSKDFLFNLVNCGWFQSVSTNVMSFKWQFTGDLKISAS